MQQLWQPMTNCYCKNQGAGICWNGVAKASHSQALAVGLDRFYIRPSIYLSNHGSINDSRYLSLSLIICICTARDRERQKQRDILKREREREREIERE